MILELIVFDVVYVYVVCAIIDAINYNKQKLLYRSSRFHTVMKTTTVIFIVMSLLCLVSCDSRSAKRARDLAAKSDTTAIVYSSTEVKCIHVQVAAYRGDSVVYWDESYFAANSIELEKYINDFRSDAIKYIDGCDSAVVNKENIVVIK